MSQAVSDRSGIKRVLSTISKRYSSLNYFVIDLNTYTKFQIRHETIRISVLQRMEEYLHVSPSSGKVMRNSATPDSSLTEEEQRAAALRHRINEPFEDLCKRHFLYYYHSYMRTIARERESGSEYSIFETMPFEFSVNAMNGKFMYHDLERRMKAVREAMDQETAGWALAGAIPDAASEGFAASLRLWSDQIAQHLIQKYEGTVMLELIDDNPFCWRITYIGRPMTNLDGALFRFRMSFSIRFPDEQPRVVFETPIYHLNITRTLRSIWCHEIRN